MENTCPACHAPVAVPDAAECPACGVIFAKWRAKSAGVAAPATQVQEKPAGVGWGVSLLVVAAALAAAGLYAKKMLPAEALASLGASRSIESEDAAPGLPFADWYPGDITPPPGTRYPCALTPLPKDLPGIPPSHRGYINHAYSLILRAVHERLKVYEELGAASPSPATLEAYLKATGELRRQISAEPAPGSLASFRDDVVAAIDLQMAFFTKAYEGRRAGRSFDQVLAIPEGRQASAKLQSAWNRMTVRYPAWKQDAKDSLYHHLCALDLF